MSMAWVQSDALSYGRHGNRQQDAGDAVEEAEALWLDPMTEDPAVLKQFLVPFPPELMDSYPVSTLVNSPKNQGREIIEPVTVFIGDHH